MAKGLKVLHLTDISSISHENSRNETDIQKNIYTKNVEAVNANTVTTSGLNGREIRTIINHYAMNMTNGENGIVTAGDQNNSNHMNIGVWDWLSEIQMTQYFDNFIDYGYETINIIQEIRNIQELIEIGIFQHEDQSKLLNQIKKMSIERQDNFPTNGR